MDLLKQYLGHLIDVDVLGDKMHTGILVDLGPDILVFISINDGLRTNKIGYLHKYDSHILELVASRQSSITISINISKMFACEHPS